ncbi:uncharacterized protein METZ01_LOCUS176806, partial [marine metagenome]
MTSISNFGQTGPYRDYVASELTLFAMGGGMHSKGLPERHPLKLGGNHVQYQAGNNAAMASLFAWYGQQYGSIGGQHIDVSIFETQMASYNTRMPALVSFQYTGERSQRLGGMRMGYPSGLYPCQDGYVLITGGGAFWPRTVAMLDMPELLEDPRFCPPNGQNDLEAKEEFEGTIWLPWVLERTKREIVEACQENEILSGAVNTIDDVVENNPQAQFRKYWITLDHPEIGSLQYPGAPVQTQDHWWQSSKSAPLLGQHNTEITEGSSERSSPATQPHTNKQTKILPLEGIRVLDITLVFAGPYGTMFLADMGAEVIRVESVNVFPTSTRGAFARPTKESEAKAPQSRYPNRDPGERPWNRVAMFNAHSRNKHSMTADLNTPEGREIFRKLVEVSDVFVENIATGAMKRLGIDWPVLKEWNPRLIMISSTGMGQTGPWSGFRGFGSHFEALLGHASVTGYRDMDPEGAPSSVAADAAAGVAISTAAVLGLHQREKTGKGAHIDLAQGENFMPHLGELFMDYMINKRVAGPPGNHDPLYVQGAYRCLGDDEWIAISLSDIDQWRRLCNFMNKPELIEDERFLDFKALQNSHNEVDKIIEEWTADQESVTLFHMLQKEGIACGPIMHEELAYADPHLKSRNF